MRNKLCIVIGLAPVPAILLRTAVLQFRSNENVRQTIAKPKPSVAIAAKKFISYVHLRVVMLSV